MYLQSLNTNMVSSQGTALDEAIETALGLFDDNSKTSKLLIMISDGEDHSEGADDIAEEATKNGLKIITIGVGTEKGGPIPIRSNGTVERFKRDKNDQVVITRLNQQILETIAKETKGGYVDGSNTKVVTSYIANSLDKIEKNEFESTQLAAFQTQFQWFAGIALVLLVIDLLLLDKKTKWLQKLNLFNEKES
jgi:Ca-activated chloride channel family protein